MRPAITPLEKDAAVVVLAALKQVKGARARHDERSGDDCAGHVVRVLQQAPGIQE